MKRLANGGHTLTLLLILWSKSINTIGNWKLLITHQEINFDICHRFSKNTLFQTITQNLGKKEPNYRFRPTEKSRISWGFLQLSTALKKGYDLEKVYQIILWSFFTVKKSGSASIFDVLSFSVLKSLY